MITLYPDMVIAIGISNQQMTTVWFDGVDCRSERAVSQFRASWEPRGVAYQDDGRWQGVGSPQGWLAFGR